MCQSSLRFQQRAVSLLPHTGHRVQLQRDVRLRSHLTSAEWFLYKLSSSVLPSGGLTTVVGLQLLLHLGKLQFTPRRHPWVRVHTHTHTSACTRHAQTIFSDSPLRKWRMSGSHYFSPHLFDSFIVYMNDKSWPIDRPLSAHLAVHERTSPKGAVQLRENNQSEASSVPSSGSSFDLRFGVQRWNLVKASLCLSRSNPLCWLYRMRTPIKMWKHLKDGQERQERKYNQMPSKQKGLKTVWLCGLWNICWCLAHWDVSDNK